MKPNFDNLRNARDFLSRLLDLPPDEAIDFLTNHGEEQVALFNESLGSEAFKIGDNVLATPEGHEEFVGTVVDVSDDAFGVVFTVKDREGDAFDCEASEIVPNQD